jgi:glycosyltransferase involved in cell wall biosynthesis
VSCDVSVVIPTYNSSATLLRALESLYGQSLPPREIIVVDDGSNDWEQSQHIAASCPQRIPVRFIHLEKNQGVSTARNTGIAAAMGRYLAFLDSDDVWYRDKLRIQYELMARHNLDFSMHPYCHDIARAEVDRDTEADREKVAADSDTLLPPVSPLTSWTPLLRNDSTNSVMVLREKMVLYDTSLRRGEDFTLYMELLARPGCRALYIRQILAGGFKSTIGASGLSRDVQGMHLGRTTALRKLLEKRTINRSQYYFGMITEMLKYPVRLLLVALRSRLAKT